MNSSLTLFNNLFDDFWTPKYQSGYDEVTRTEEGGYEIVLEVPGFKKEDLEIHLEDQLLQIKGEKQFKNKLKSINRNYTIPKNLDAEKSIAKVEDGLLVITLNLKKEKEQKRFLQIL